MKTNKDIAKSTSKSPFGGFRGLWLVVFLLLVSCGNDQPQLPINRIPVNPITENLMEVNRVLLELEMADIENFLEKSDITFSQYPLFWYYIENQGGGIPVERRQIVRVKYYLSLLDGTICATPERGGTQTIAIGSYDIIKGLDHALLMLNEGGSGKFIIPSHFAFGVEGDRVCIGSRRTVVYDIVSVEILH